MTRADDTPTHFIIPDTQVKPGVPLDHLEWIGRYLVEKSYGRPEISWLHLGDHWDFPSLSRWEKKGGVELEGKRYAHDVEAGNYGFDLLNSPLFLENESKRRKWEPKRRKFFRGNHEHRAERAAADDAVLEGTISPDDLNVTAWDWESHDFLEPVELEGVTYSHYFANPMSGRPYGGQSIDTRLKTIGYSFTMGHQQGLHVGMRDLTNGRRLRGMVAGSCYLHDEKYAGPQGNHVWRGILVAYKVENGSYDLKEVSLDSLCRRYEGVSLARFKPRVFWTP